MDPINKRVSIKRYVGSAPHVLTIPYPSGSAMYNIISIKLNLMCSGGHYCWTQNFQKFGVFEVDSH